MQLAKDAIAASSFSYYNLLKGYPVAGWGEQGIVAVQATVVLMLVWIYRKGANRSNLKLRRNKLETETDRIKSGRLIKCGPPRGGFLFVLGGSTAW